jgi:hypothetical protein
VSPSASWNFHGIYTHVPAPNAAAAEPSSASIAMAAMIYLFVIPYCFSVGPVPWVYCSEIFNNRTRSYGLAVASSSQWLWNLIISRYTPNMVLELKNGGIFFFFAGINVIAAICAFFLPETRGLSLEQMDVIFGLVTAEERAADLARAQDTLDKNLGEDLDEKPSDQRVERV